MYNIKDYGAKGDKINNDRLTIQATIDDCSKHGGGVVYFPPGDYLTGNIKLRSDIRLLIDSGATVWASRNKKDYDNVSSKSVSVSLNIDVTAALFEAENIENVCITGSGNINLQADEDFGEYWGKPEKPDFRVKTLLMEHCKNVNITELTFTNGDNWGLHLKCCQDVVIDRVKMFNNYHRLNSDGIDPDSCKNVTISNCHIHIGDDCIVMKSTTGIPCENIVVINCILETPCTAIKIGTESLGDFRDIHISNCIIRNTAVGIGIYVKDGATVERVTFQNISIENAALENIKPICPFFMDIEKRFEDSKIGKIRDVLFNGIQIASGSGIIVQGMPQSLIENVTLQNISFRVTHATDITNRKKPVTGTRKTSDERDTCYARQPYYMCLAHIRGLTVENYRLIMDEQISMTFDRSVLYGSDIHHGYLRNVNMLPNGRENSLEVIALNQCEDIVIL